MIAHLLRNEAEILLERISQYLMLPSSPSQLGTLNGEGLVHIDLCLPFDPKFCWMDINGCIMALEGGLRKGERIS
jgi:hypothetical protein